jgi:hypothetical protein
MWSAEPNAAHRAHRLRAGGVSTDTGIPKKPVIMGPPRTHHPTGVSYIDSTNNDIGVSSGSAGADPLVASSPKDVPTGRGCGSAHTNNRIKSATEQRLSSCSSSVVSRWSLRKNLSMISVIFSIAGCGGAAGGHLPDPEGPHCPTAA